MTNFEVKFPNEIIGFLIIIFTSPQAFHSNETIAFYSMLKFESWKDNLGINANGWKIKYYKI